MFKINFSFGVKKATFKTILVLTIIVATLSSCLKIDEKNIWDLIYEYLKTYQPNSPILPELRKDPGIVDRDVKRTVTGAIDQVTPEYDRIIREADKKYQPRYMDLKNNESECYTDECKSLAPPMRICSPVVEGIDCPKTIKN
jgi:hypothetical protein